MDGTAVGLLVTGAALAAVLGSVALAIARYVPAWQGARAIPLGGIVLAAPLVLIVPDGGALSLFTLIGLGVLLVVGFALPKKLPPLARGAATVPGAAILAVGVEGIALLVVVMSVPIIATAIATFEEGHDYEHGLATILAAIATGGAFLTVPDTEHVALLAGAGTIVAILVLLQPRLALGGSSLVWTGAFVWAMAMDGAARATAVVGALGALGLLIIDPVVRSFVPLHRGLVSYLPTIGARQQLVVAAVIQTVLALFTSRVAGFQQDVILSIVLTLAAWTLVAVLLGYRARSLH